MDALATLLVMIGFGCLVYLIAKAIGRLSKATIRSEAEETAVEAWKTPSPGVDAHAYMENLSCRPYRFHRPCVAWKREVFTGQAPVSEIERLNAAVDIALEVLRRPFPDAKLSSVVWNDYIVFYYPRPISWEQVTDHIGIAPLSETLPGEPQSPPLHANDLHLREPRRNRVPGRRWMKWMDKMYDPLSRLGHLGFWKAHRTQDVKTNPQNQSQQR